MLIELFRQQPTLVAELPTAEGGAPVPAVIVEAQLGRDRGKQWSRPAYLATLRARLRCPVVLLVVCSDAAVARWCAAPIALGHPGLVLSAMAHGAGPEGHAVLDALVSALQTVDVEHAYLEAMMVTLSYRDDTTFVGQYFTRGYTEGRAEGKIEAILTHRTVHRRRPARHLGPSRGHRRRRRRPLRLNA